MSEPKTDCPNYPNCIQTAVWNMFARVGNRQLVLPDCEQCNIYIPPDKRSDNNAE